MRGFYIAYASLLPLICAAHGPPFGGLSAHLGNLSVVLHLDTAEAIGAAQSYDALLSTHMGELARARASLTAGVVYFMDLLSAERHRFNTHAVSQASKNSQPHSVTTAPAKSPDADLKAPAKRVWIPKKHYMGHLAAERRAPSRLPPQRNPLTRHLRPARAGAAAPDTVPRLVVDRILVVLRSVTPRCSETKPAATLTDVPPSLFLVCSKATASPLPPIFRNRNLSF